MNFQSFLIAAVLLSTTPLIILTGATHKQHRYSQEKAYSQVVGDFPIIGIFKPGNFILGSGASISFKVEESLVSKTENWQIGDVVRQVILDDSTLYGLQNITRGDVVQAEALPLDENRYTKRVVGTLCILMNNNGDILLADHNHYKISILKKFDLEDWKETDPVYVTMKRYNKTLFILKNLRSGATVETKMTYPF